MVRDNTQVIQAMPIKASTYVGTPANKEARGYNIVHCNTDVTLTFNFGANGNVVISAMAGQDFAFDNTLVNLTASGEVIMS